MISFRMSQMFQHTMNYELFNHKQCFVFEKASNLRSNNTCQLKHIQLGKLGFIYVATCCLFPHVSMELTALPTCV